MDLENDSIVTEADHISEHLGLRLAMYEGPPVKGYVQIPDELVGMWGSIEEVGQALDLPYPLSYGPHPDIIGYPENDRWLGIDELDLLAIDVRRHGVVLVDPISRRIHAELHDLIGRLVTAAAFAERGNPMAPVELTYSHEDVLDLRVVTGDQEWVARIHLRDGESSWRPDMPYAPFTGPCDVEYRGKRGRVKAIEHPM